MWCTHNKPKNKIHRRCVIACLRCQRGRSVLASVCLWALAQSTNKQKMNLRCLWLDRICLQPLPTTTTALCIVLTTECVWVGVWLFECVSACIPYVCAWATLGPTRLLPQLASLPWCCKCNGASRHRVLTLVLTVCSTHHCGVPRGTQTPTTQLHVDVCTHTSPLYNCHYSPPKGFPPTHWCVFLFDSLSCGGST